MMLQVEMHSLSRRRPSTSTTSTFCYFTITEILREIHHGVSIALLLILHAIFSLHVLGATHI
jgi:hypothetical protein